MKIDARLVARMATVVLALTGCDNNGGEDAGVDAGGRTDSGVDIDSGGGGTDAGRDAGGGMDAGPDAGDTMDGGGGTDAGGDGGGTDAGSDGGGPPRTDYVYYSGDFATDGAFNVGRRNIATGINEVLAPMGLTDADDITAFAVSRDGTRLAIAGRAAPTDADVINVYAADGTGTPVTIFTAPAMGRSVDQLEFSPDGLTLAFSGPFETTGAFDNNDNALFVAPADGSGSATRVSPNVPANNLVVVEFLWVDATHLVFTGDVETNNVDSIWSVETSTPGAPVQLVPASTLAMFTTTQDIFNDAIAVDSMSRIYFGGDFVGAGGEFHLYRNVLDGSSFEEVPGTAMTRGGTMPTSVSAFGISNDGLTLAFGADATTAGIDDVFVMALSGSTPARVDAFASMAAFGQSLDVGEPIAFSPDGTLLAFGADFALTAGDADNAFAVFVVPATGTGGARLFGVPADANLDASAVFWSPDGTEVFARADYVTNGEAELFGTTDLSTANQAIAGLLLVDSPLNGDVFRAAVASLP
jgi:Tol biopolymer transport system component